MTTATTLRVSEPYMGQGKILVGDSWFGSVKSAAELLKRGTYSVLNVKTASKLYPKKVIKELRLVRGQSKHYKAMVDIHGEARPVFASVHMDSQPMSLVHTCSTSMTGKQAIRTWRKYVNGTVKRRKYTLEQPKVFQIYRSHYNAVDNFNKLALGPKSSQYAYRTPHWDRRVFMALLAMAETNAFLAYRALELRAGRRPMVHATWRRALSAVLIHNPYRPQFARMRAPVPLAERPLLEGHANMYMQESRNMKVCEVCGTRTAVRCSCGAAVCAPNRNLKQCYATHLLDVVDVETWQYWSEQTKNARINPSQHASQG